MPRNNSTKPKSESNGTITLIIAILGVAGTLGAAYFGYLSTRTQIELPISATQTAESKMGLVASSTAFFTPSQIPLTDSSLTHSETIFSLDTANESEFTLTRSSEIILTDILQVTGDNESPVYIKSKLPDNFKSEIQFHIESIDNGFRVGIGKGESVLPNYRFSMGQEYFALKSNDSQGNDRFIDWQDMKLEANKTYDLVFARTNGVLKVCLGGKFWSSLTGEESETVKFTNFFINSNSRVSSQGTAFVTYLKIESLGENVDSVCSAP